MPIASFDILDQAGEANRENKIRLKILEKGNENSQTFLNINRCTVVTATRCSAAVTATSNAREVQIRQ